VQAIRQIRSEYNVSPGAVVAATVQPTTIPMSVFAKQSAVIGSLSRATVTISDAAPIEASASVVTSSLTVHLPLAGMIDLDKERARLGAEISQLEGPLAALLGRLSNEKFMAKAPPAVVEGERAKAAEWQGRLDLLRQKLAQLDA
jgi:valyl-tRNA synthetase